MGFEPHADWAMVKYFVEPELPFDDTLFKFGKDGKPFYVVGPYETRETREKYARMITAVGGDWVMPV